jgi:hypothetical protein
MNSFYLNLNKLGKEMDNQMESEREERELRNNNNTFASGNAGGAFSDSN